MDINQKRNLKSGNKGGLRISKSVRNFIKLMVIGLFIATLAVFSISAYVGWKLTHPEREKITSNPSEYGLKYEEITFKSVTDNINLKGWLTASPQNKKTVILAHGYRNSRIQKTMPLLPIAKDLVDNGFNVILFDFRNSGESEGNLTSVGEFEVQDLLGAYQYVNSRNDLSHKVVFYGFSMGGSTSIVACAKEPGVSGVIADSPFSDLKVYLATNLPKWSNLPEVPFNRAFFMIVPIMTGIDMDSVSPVKEVKNFGGRPLLLIHSKDDELIPYENSVLIKNAYNKAELYSTQGATHVKSLILFFAVSIFLKNVFIPINYARIIHYLT